MLLHYELNQWPAIRVEEAPKTFHQQGGICSLEVTNSDAPHSLRSTNMFPFRQAMEAVVEPFTPPEEATSGLVDCFYDPCRKKEAGAEEGRDGGDYRIEDYKATSSRERGPLPSGKARINLLEER